MNIIEALVLNSIFILFPLFSYFLFATHEQSLGRKISNILFIYALYSSLYLILRYNTPFIEIKMMFVAIPLLIMYLKNNRINAIIFSICIAAYYIYPLEINAFYVVLEFIIYFGLMDILKRMKQTDMTIISIFVIIKVTFIIIDLYNFQFGYAEILNGLFVLPLAFYSTTHMICYLLTASEKTMNLHMTIKELEREKQLRDSLFKITHEIKNPIAVCKGYLDMFDVNNNDHVKRYIPIIKQEIERTLTLMNDFMMLTKINVELKKMDVSVLLQDVSEIAYLMLKEKKYKFYCSIIDEELYIDGDYDRLKQVFMNIIKNAMEAIPSDRKGIVKFNAKKTPKGMVINIIDNGVGIDKEALSKIGEAFYTTKKTGTGLGVKFSQEIVAAHDGNINYKSKPNIGTTVTIKLPLKKSLL